jgi:hypothetical protein
MRFCGTRGGSPFVNVARPVSTGKIGATAYECPKDFVACSTATSLENTICVNKSKTADCPITFAKFVTVADAAATYSDTAYTVQEVDKEYKFVTSKTKGDNLPLTSFKIEEKPCLNNKDTSRATTSTFYPLENDRNAANCSIVDQFNERYDTRYVNMGIKVSEYDVQDESGVLDDLEDLPNYSKYVTSTAKKNVKYTFWSRSTISWKLECDATHSRDSVVAAAAFEKEKESLHEDTVIIFSAIGYVIGFIVSTVIFVVYFVGTWKRRDQT